MIWNQFSPSATQVFEIFATEESYNPEMMRRRHYHIHLHPDRDHSP